MSPLEVLFGKTISYAIEEPHVLFNAIQCLVLCEIIHSLNFKPNLTKQYSRFSDSEN